MKNLIKERKRLSKQKKKLEKRLKDLSLNLTSLRAKLYQLKRELDRKRKLKEKLLEEEEKIVDLFLSPLYFSFLLDEVKKGIDKKIDKLEECILKEAIDFLANTPEAVDIFIREIIMRDTHDCLVKRLLSISWL